MPGRGRWPVRSLARRSLRIRRSYYHAPPGGYPYAERTGTPGYVYSPYGNHNVIDVRGVPPGALVRDPSTGGIFRKP